MTEATDEIVDDVASDAAEDTQKQAADAAVEAEGGKPDEADATAEAAVDEAAKAEEADTGEDAEKKGPSELPDDWREVAAAGDADTLKLLGRYKSLSGVAKALAEAQKLIRSGKVQMERPDPSDEKAMAEWRKEQGVPEDPTGYKLPEDVTKRLTDEDKPVLSAFTEFAHAKGARPDVVEIGAAWYIDQMEALAEKQSEADKIARDEAESTLRKDWAHAEYKANTVLGKRFISTIPGMGEAALGMRGADGRMLGDNPEFIAWAAEQGRNTYGDVAFVTGDSERKHEARREEIEKIRDTDFERYENEGLDKELRDLIEKDLTRGKR